MSRADRWLVPRPLGESARRELERFVPALGMEKLVAAWPDAVGEAIAANAWPARVARDGTLHVAASSSAWAFELTQLEETVRARLHDALGDEAPPRLRFAPGPLPERGAPDVPTSARNVPTVEPTDRLEGERLAADIDDAELRALVARAAAASLARARGKAADRRLW